MDLIVTQAVCEVCAVSFDDVRAVAERLPTQPEVISLDPSTLGEVLADVPRLAAAAGAGRGRRAARRRGRRADRGGRAGRGGRAAPARGRARVARPALRGRPLGAADDRAGRRRGRARPAGREVAHRRVGRARGGRAGGDRVDAVRLLRRAGGRRDDQAARAARPARARACSRWTPPPTSRAPARVSWRAWSCSATCSTPSSCRRRRRGARSSWTWRPSRTGRSSTAIAADAERGAQRARGT